MSAVEGDGNVILYRIGRNEKRLDEVEKWRRDVDDDRQDLKYLQAEVSKLAKTVDGLRKTLLAFAFTIAGSAVVFALTVLIATGKIGGK